MKIRSMGAELSMRTDGQTNITNLIAAFLNFANAPNDEVRIVDSPIKFAKEVHQ